MTTFWRIKLAARLTPSQYRPVLPPRWPPDGTGGVHFEPDDHLPMTTCPRQSAGTYLVHLFGGTYLVGTYLVGWLAGTYLAGWLAVERAQQRIVRAGLPRVLADRLA